MNPRDLLGASYQSLTLLKQEIEFWQEQVDTSNPGTDRDDAIIILGNLKYEAELVAIRISHLEIITNR